MFGRVTRGSVSAAARIIGRRVGSTTACSTNSFAAEAVPSVGAQPIGATRSRVSFTGQPPQTTAVQDGAMRIVKAVTGFLGIDFGTQIAPLMAFASPPFFTTRGLGVQRSEFEGVPVYTIASADRSGKYVVALPGGAYVVQPTFLHWFAYAAIARDTGATVVVPIYPLAKKSEGRAETVIPVMADLISAQIAQYGASSVNVYGDSAGGGMALAAAQLLVERGAAIPSHMVLISPWLDVTMSNPAIASIDDPVLDPVVLKGTGSLWAGDLDPTDPLVSPLYGSLVGLPPTALYAGSRDVLSPDVLILQYKAFDLDVADN
jgi:triacylglycerol lipase